MGLGERLNGIQEVSGSIPLISTRKALKSQDFRASVCRKSPAYRWAFSRRYSIISLGGGSVKSFAQIGLQTLE